MEIFNKKECNRNTILSHELENMWQNLYPLDYTVFCDHLWKFIDNKLDTRWFFCLQNITETELKTTQQHKTKHDVYSLQGQNARAM